MVETKSGWLSLFNLDVHKAASRNQNLRRELRE